MAIAFVNISILNKCFFPLAAKTRFSRVCANVRFILQRDGSDLFAAQGKVGTVRLKKFSLQKYGSKTKVFLDTRRKNGSSLVRGRASHT